MPYRCEKKMEKKHLPGNDARYAAHGHISPMVIYDHRHHRLSHRLTYLGGEVFQSELDGVHALVQHASSDVYR